MKKWGSLQKAGMAPLEGGIRVRDAVEAFLRYTDKPIVAAADAVTQGLSQACRDRLIAIGRGTSPQSLQTKRCGEFVALDRAEDGVWIIPPFAEQPVPSAAETGSESAGAVVGGALAPVGNSGNPSTSAVLETLATAPTDAVDSLQSLRISGNVPLESWTELFRCLINPAARLNPKVLRLGIDIQLVARDDQPFDVNDPTLKAMREAAQQLGLETAEETDTS